jgi:hypothetical protein
MSDNRILRTRYFEKATTWLKRTFLTAILLVITFLWSFASNQLMLPIIVGTLLVVVIWSTSVDDLLLDDIALHHSRRSLFPFLSSETSYEIKQIVAVRATGNYSPSREIFDLLTFARFNQSINTMEISLANGETIRLNLTIYRRDLNQFVTAIESRTKASR